MAAARAAARRQDAKIAALTEAVHESQYAVDAARARDDHPERLRGRARLLPDAGAGGGGGGGAAIVRRLPRRRRPPVRRSATRCCHERDAASSSGEANRKSPAAAAASPRSACAPRSPT